METQIINDFKPEVRSLLSRLALAGCTIAHEPRHVAALVGASEATILRLKEVLDRIPVAEEPAPPKDDRTTDDWAEQVAPQFVKDVDTHIEMMSELRGAEAYQLRRMIVISLRQLFRDKNLGA